MTKRNKANADRDIKKVIKKCEKKPEVEFKNGFGQKRKGQALSCVMGKNHIIQVIILIKGEKYPNHVPINKIKGW